jgi:voltage-gated potassium channel
MVHTHNPLVWIGLAGLPPDDNPRAVRWERRLHWVMVAVALLSLPAYVLDTAEGRSSWHRLATFIDTFILIAFFAEIAWMTALSSFPGRYLAENWLNLVVVLGAAAALFGATTEWIALVRVARVAVAGIILLRALAQLSVLFTRRGAPLLVGVGALSMLAAGGMFYWLDPAITSFWDGLWLAFITGTTVGYGDIVPTTGAARVIAVFVVLAGWAMLSLFTANIVARFVGREETQLRQELHREIVHLRREIGRLVDTEEIRFREDLHRDVNQLRRQIAQLINAEELQFRRQFQQEIEGLRTEVAALRAELARRDTGVSATAVADR